jgi:hypothetical protein
MEEGRRNGRKPGTREVEIPSSEGKEDPPAISCDPIGGGDFTGTARVRSIDEEEELRFLSVRLSERAVCACEEVEMEARGLRRKKEQKPKK